MAGPYSYGIAIEGVGLDTAKSAGTCWYFGLALTAAQQSASNYDWEGGANSNSGLVEQESMRIDTQVDPFTGDLRDSAFTFQLHYSDNAAQNLIYLQVVSTMFLTLGEDAASVSINISGTGNDGLANSVIWVNDEAIKLGTHAGGGVYSSGVTRGYYGTTAQNHYIGTTVYTKNPYLSGRQIKLIQFDHSDDSETVKWTGFVNDQIGTAQDGLVTSIPCQGLLSVLKGAVVNRGAPKLSGGRSWVNVGDGIQMSGHAEHSDLGKQKRVAKADDVAHKQAYHIGAGVVFGDYSDTGKGNAPATTFRESSSTSKTMMLEPDADLSVLNGSVIDLEGLFEKTTGDAYEVLAIDRRIDEEAALAAANMHSATRDLTFPFHPVEISLALLTSSRGTAASTSTTTWDALGYEWGVGAPVGWFDASGISTVIDETKDRKIDRLVLGVDGEPVQAWPVCKSTLMAPHGFFFGTTSAGLVNVGRFKGAADIADSINATAITAIPRTLEWLPSRSDTVDVIVGRVGATPLGDEGVPITVNARDYATGESTNSLRAALFSQRKEFEIDYQTMTDAESLAEELISKIITLHLASPRVRMRVSNADTYDIGAFFTFTATVQKYPENNGWFVTNAGAMTATTTGASFIGMLIGRTLDISDRSYTLTLLLTNYRLGKYPRHRPPTAEVVSWDEPSKTITVEADQFGTTFDGKNFLAGMYVEIWRPNYQLRSGTVGAPDAHLVNSSTSTTIVLNTVPATAPVAGDLVELAHLTTATGYPEDGTTQPYLGGTVNTYSFLGASGTVGAEAVTAHIYSDE